MINFILIKNQQRKVLIFSKQPFKVAVPEPNIFRRTTACSLQRNLARSILIIFLFFAKLESLFTQLLFRWDWKWTSLTLIANLGHTRAGNKTRKKGRQKLWLGRDMQNWADGLLPLMFTFKTMTKRNFPFCLRLVLSLIHIWRCRRRG